MRGEILHYKNKKTQKNLPKNQDSSIISVIFSIILIVAGSYFSIETCNPAIETYNPLKEENLKIDKTENPTNKNPIFSTDYSKILEE